MTFKAFFFAASLSLAGFATVSAAQDPALLKKAASDSAANVPQLTFDKTVHDFGTFAEEKGKVTCTFSFKNTGKGDLVIQKVRASCGCTTPNWTKTPVAPGDTGFVTATYNASGRPGNFNKTITVTSNANGDQRLTIRGEVIPRVKSPEEEYPFAIGDFRLKSQNVYMRTVEYPSSKTERLQVLNNSSQKVTLSFPNAPKYLNIVANPVELAPKAKGVIEISLNTKEANDWGEVNPNFDVAVNGKVEKDRQVLVHATIRENFANMTAEEKEMSPSLQISNNIELGKVDIKKKKTLKYKFSFSNTGKTDLIIRKAKSNNDAVKLIVPSKPVKPGKKADLVVEVNTLNAKPGKFSYRATIISNDYKHSTLGITLQGEYQ